MIRIKAALSHLLLSVLIFSIVIATLIFIWYPAPHFTASGGWQGLKIAAAVDLALGPLLTLIIFDITKPRKKLVGDLIVIGLLQFTALAWGVSTIYSQRPVALVFWEYSFVPVPALALTNQKIPIRKLAKFGGQKPVLIYAERPKDIDGLKQMSLQINDNHIAPHYQLELYRPLQEYYDEIVPFQVNMDIITSQNPYVKVKLDKILEEANTKNEDYDYFRLRSKTHNIILLFSHDGKIKNHIIMPL